MITQDAIAVALCALAFAWLARRLLAANVPPASRPDVTAAALVRRTRERRAEKPSAGDHCAGG